MAEPFKNAIDDGAVGWLADQIGPVHPGFDRDRFVGAACDGLEALELKARVAHVAAALRPCLPESWPDALAVLIDALPPRTDDATYVSAGMVLWPVLHLVEVAGLDHPEASLDALPALTNRFTAEFAIRPYLRDVPEQVWPRLQRWTAHDDVHVRRLCSEGTRPRLPWGLQLKDAIVDPTPGLGLLDVLVDDPELYVRRSVANHLNDVSKDHPELAVATAEKWMASATPERTWVAKHALRSLVKRGHPGALAVLGFGPAQATLDALEVDIDPVAIGAHTRVTATLTAAADQRWLVDWVVRSPKANGELSTRVAKGKQVEVAAGQTLTLTHRLSLEPVTTRVTRPGTWRVAVQVNGQVMGDVALGVTGDAR